MTSEPATSMGRLIRAVAHRDNDSFKLWRADLNLSEEARAPLYDLIFEVFLTLVLIRFQNLANGGQVKEFAHHEHLILWPDSGFDRDKAERLIRSALGERGQVSDISLTEAVLLRLQLITYLVEDLSLVDDQIVQLIADGERAIAKNS